MPGIKKEIRQQIRAIIFLAVAALGFAALNLTAQTGEVGTFINNILRTLTGELAVVIPLAFAIFGLQAMLPQRMTLVRQRLIGMLLFAVVLLVSAHMRLLADYTTVIQEEGIMRPSLQMGLEQQGGGIIGGILTVALFFLFRDLGSMIFIMALSLISFLLITNYSFTQIINNMLSVLKYLLKSVQKLFLSVWGVARRVLSSSVEEEEVVEEEDYELPFSAGIPFGKQDNTWGGADSSKQQPAKKTPPYAENKHEDRDNPLIVETAKKADISPRKYSSTNQYDLPPLNLLSKPTRPKDGSQPRTVGERAKILERTLDSFGVKAKVVNIQTGPTVTRYELQPEIGVKVSKIVSLADDLSLNLASPDVRIEAPIPGKAAVGIEVPNKIIAPVYLRDVLEDKQFGQSSSPLTIGFGQDITGTPVIADLIKMPHLLIAGSTGSGKSVCLNTLIASILFKASPEEVKFMMIDPKMVELSSFNGIPHLLMPVVTDAKKASLALRNMLKEMARRYELFAADSVRDISRYNEKLRMTKETEKLLPYVVVIIDELADLMMVAAADVEDSIARLSQMSRAAGIHLVIATQRPSVDVITGVIKANITSRIAFAVSSMVDSRTILDQGGAEKLLGRGDMLLHLTGTSKPFRVQGAFMNERELNSLLEHVKSQGEPEYSDELLPGEEEEDAWYEEDELFSEALSLLSEAGTASISLLQRRLRIGYARAARLIDDMERRGFVGKYEGSKAREVLVTPEQVYSILQGGRQDGV